jgi:hypothetical protein
MYGDINTFLYRTLLFSTTLLCALAIRPHPLPPVHDLLERGLGAVVQVPVQFASTVNTDVRNVYKSEHVQPPRPAPRNALAFLRTCLAYLGFHAAALYTPKTITIHLLFQRSRGLLHLPCHLSTATLCASQGSVANS